MPDAAYSGSVYVCKTSSEQSTWGVMTEVADGTLDVVLFSYKCADCVGEKWCRECKVA